MANGEKIPELEDVCTPRAIEERSFAIIDGEIPAHDQLPGILWIVARRCIHALGDTAILPDFRISQAAVDAGLAALKQRCTIFTDTAMLAAGLVARRMVPLGARVVPLMGLPGLGEKARAEGKTRARAGVEMIAPQMGGQIVAIGNAPTALLALLEALEKGFPTPALIVGMPVGFVNAARSKELLERSPWRHITLLGRKGGSAVAAACVNALAELALGEKTDALS